jgi:serine carboxypeptidase-like clade 2
VYDGLTLVTIRGAGHMVPMIKPVQASQVFTHFLDGNELPAKPVAATAA